MLYHFVYLDFHIPKHFHFITFYAHSQFDVRTIFLSPVVHTSDIIPNVYNLCDLMSLYSSYIVLVTTSYTLCQHMSYCLVSRSPAHSTFRIDIVFIYNLSIIYRVLIACSWASIIIPFPSSNHFSSTNIKFVHLFL